VFSLNLLISGYGKFNLFDGVHSKEQNIAVKFSSVLGFPVNKEIIACVADINLPVSNPQWVVSVMQAKRPLPCPICTCKRELEKI